MMKPPKDSNMENDEQIWDELLESAEGLDAFALLMEEAKQEVALGETEEN